MTGDWKQLGFGDALRTLDADFDLEGLLAKSAPRSNGADAEAQAEAIEVRAADSALVAASEGLLRSAADLSPYLRRGPQGYWFEFLERAFREGVAPSLVEPTVVHSLPLESSPLAQSSDGVHCDKWELYVGGLRVALAQRELMDADAQAVRFRHIEHLRRQGYDVLPEPDRRFVEELRRWPSGAPLVGMGVYLDRLLGVILGLVTPDGRGQERMLPQRFQAVRRRLTGRWTSERPASKSWSAFGNWVSTPILTSFAAVIPSPRRLRPTMPTATPGRYASPVG